MPTKSRNDLLERIKMNKQKTIDQTNVLNMALVGFALQRDRIEAAMTEIQTELDQGRKGTSTATATASAEPEKTGRRKFSSAARKRMALAQKKRWKLLKAKKAEAGKPKRKAAVKRKKAGAAPARKQGPVQVKAVKKIARKVVKVVLRAKATVKKAPNAKIEKPAVETPKTVNETPVPDVATVESVPEAATE
jgi:hypothetical protein